MSSPLTLTALRRDEDPRVVVLSLSLGGQGFEEHFVVSSQGAVASPRSAFGFTREELALRPLVDRWLKGEAVALPAPVRAPEALSPKEQRRKSFLDGQWAKDLMAGASPT